MLGTRILEIKDLLHTNKYVRINSRDFSHYMLLSTMLNIKDFLVGFDRRMQVRIVFTHM